MALHDIALSWLTYVHQSLLDNTDPRSGRNIFNKARNSSVRGRSLLLYEVHTESMFYTCSSLLCRIICGIHVCTRIGITGDVVLDDQADRVTPYVVYHYPLHHQQMTPVFNIVTSNPPEQVRFGKRGLATLALRTDGKFMKYMHVSSTCSEMLVSINV